jgi:hypothetical protein
MRCLGLLKDNNNNFAGVSTTSSLEPIYANISPVLQAELQAETLAIASDESKVFSNESCM